MTRSTTKYLHPPKRVPKRGVAELSPVARIRRFLFRYRSQLIPFLIAFHVAGLAVAFGPVGARATALGAGTCLVLAGVLLQEHWEPSGIPWFRLDRPVEHRYAAACASVTGLWWTLATWGGIKPSLYALEWLVFLTAVTAAPWWHHRRIRGSIPVRFDNVSGAERARRLIEVKKLIKDWTAFTSAGQVQGARLRAVQVNPWSISLAVQLRRGGTLREFTPLRLDKLASAAEFDGVKAGMVRVERILKYPRMMMMRFMINDPHELPITPPATGGTNMHEILIGLFETGESILFTMVNTLIAGITGSGKSGLVNMLIRAFASIPQVAIVGIDLKPGSPELGPWRKVMHALATDPAETKELLARLIKGLEYRGAVMQANRWRNWKPSREHPFIVLIVDEVQLVKVAGLSQPLDTLTGIIRQYGGIVIVATQYPTGPNISPTIKENCKQKIGMQTGGAVGDRVIFGEDAGAQGFRPSVLVDPERQGSLLIKSPIYKKALLGRAFWVDDDDVAAAVEQWAPVRTQIDSGTWNHLDGADGDTPELPAGQPVGADGSPVVDAVIVEDDPAELILNALRAVSSVKEIVAVTGLSRPTVNRHLIVLMDQDRVSHPSRGVYRLADTVSVLSQEDT